MPDSLLIRETLGPVTRLTLNAPGSFNALSDAMLAALERHFPPEVRWTKPQGGLFLWVTLPEGFDSTSLLKEALDKERVAFVPGASFFPRGGGERSCRLNFSYAGPDVIDEGMRRLGSVIKRRLASRA